MPSEESLVNEFSLALNENLLKKWYPLVVDTEYGGYFTNVTYDWRLPEEQEKMIVTQARHVWTAAKVASYLDDAGYYTGIAQHGYKFLRDVMWDKQYGGFYQIRNRRGQFSNVRGWRDEKRAYGNAFALFAIAALYDLTRDHEMLEFSRRVFSWIEGHSFDPICKGYFQFLTREGERFDWSSEYETIASDSNEVGYKDQNSSIHLLEAYTELYTASKDPHVREQLASLLALIRDTMVSEKGFLQLFFHQDWTPVSFVESPPEVLEENFGLDHVSFGHDVETAFLMLEASHALGLESDTRTLAVAKKMLDHALANGWDRTLGGFYDAAYYFKGAKRCRIVRETKNWWAQAEGLNALLLFSRIFPEERYGEYFLKQWHYVKKYVLDHDQGDWFEGGLDKEPHLKTGPKSHIWKCTYHTSRSLMNCITLMSNGGQKETGEGFIRRKKKMAAFVNHWRETARAIPGK